MQRSCIFCIVILQVAVICNYLTNLRIHAILMSIDVYVDINIPVNYELHDAMTFVFGFYSFKSSFNEILVCINTLLYIVGLDFELLYI